MPSHHCLSCAVDVHREGICILAYGVLAGGFLTDRWLKQPVPSTTTLANRSLIKYLLMIEEWGKWESDSDTYLQTHDMPRTPQEDGKLFNPCCLC